MWRLRMALIVITVASAVVAVIGLAAQISPFGVSSDDAFSGWTHLPLLIAGGIGFLVAGVTLVVVAMSRRSDAPVIAVVAGTLAVLVVALGFWRYDVRSHPHGFEQSAIARLAVPAAATSDITTYGSTPEDGSPTARAAHYGPPVAVRSWGPTDCAALHGALVAWADRGTVKPPRPGAVAISPPCYFTARYRGWQVAGEILHNRTTGTAEVILAPPPVGL